MLFLSSLTQNFHSWNCEIKANHQKNSNEIEPFYSMFDFIAYRWYYFAWNCLQTNKQKHSVFDHMMNEAIEYSRIFYLCCHLFAVLLTMVKDLSVVSSSFNRNIYISKCFYLLHSIQWKNVFLNFCYFCFLFLPSFIVSLRSISKQKLVFCVIY